MAKPSQNMVAMLIQYEDAAKKDEDALAEQMVTGKIAENAESLTELRQLGEAAQQAKEIKQKLTDLGEPTTAAEQIKQNELFEQIRVLIADGPDSKNIQTVKQEYKAQIKTNLNYKVPEPKPNEIEANSTAPVTSVPLMLVHYEQAARNAHAELEEELNKQKKPSADSLTKLAELKDNADTALKIKKKLMAVAKMSESPEKEARKKECNVLARDLIKEAPGNFQDSCRLKQNRFALLAT